MNDQSPSTPILVNRHAGSLRAVPVGLPRRVQAWVEERRESGMVQPVKGKDIRKALKRTLADGVSRVAVGGGDGTLSTAASFCSEAGVELVPLPMGTLNHFAKDVGISPEPDDWDALIRSNSVRPVDLGLVAGDVFLNNFSIGFYPAMAKIRKEYSEERILGSKRLATLVSTAQAYISSRRLELGLDIEGEDSAHTQIVCQALIVANNSYDFATAQVMGRSSLRGGRLVTYIVRDISHVNSLEILSKYWENSESLSDMSGLEVVTCEALTITAPRRRVSLAIDGELTHFSKKLGAQIKPQALSVVVP